MADSKVDASTKLTITRDDSVKVSKDISIDSGDVERFATGEVTIASAGNVVIAFSSLGITTLTMVAVTARHAVSGEPRSVTVYSNTSTKIAICTELVLNAKENGDITTNIKILANSSSGDTIVEYTLAGN